MSKAKHTDAAMEKLFPTPNRLALLRSVDSGKVSHCAGVTRDWSSGWRVDNRVVELSSAGWVEVDPADAENLERFYILTAEGSRVLRTYGGTDG